MQVSDKWNVTNPNRGEQSLDGFPRIAYESEEAARVEMECVRWPAGVFCPKCGSVEKCWRIRSRDVGGGSGARAGVWRCSFCRCQFTVTVGTALQNTKLPLSCILRGLACMSGNRDPWAVGELRVALGTSHRSARAFAKLVINTKEGKEPCEINKEEFAGRNRRKRNAFIWPVPPIQLLRCLLQTAKTKPF